MRNLVVIIAILGLMVRCSVSQEQPIHDAAYVEAIQTKNPNERAAKIERCISDHPNSADLQPALEELLKTYSNIGDIQRTENTARRLLQIDPKNLSALEVLTYLCRITDDFPTQEASDKWRTECKDVADRALSILESDLPDTVSKQRFRKLRVEATKVLLAIEMPGDPNGSDLQKALHDAPNDFGLVYPLALAYLNSPKPECAKGLWYIARAAILAPTPNYKKKIAEFGQRKMIDMHGDKNDWTKLMSLAGKSATPPPNFQIQCAPSWPEQRP